MVEGISELTIHCDVAVVGGGPAGLGAARQLRRLGVGHVMVLEREAMAGGIPRHCGHPPFGWQEFHRILTGPKYASRLVKSAESEGVDIRVQFTVTGLEQGPHLARVNSRRNASCESKTNCFDHRCSGNSQSGAHGLRQPADGRSDHRCAAIHGIPQIAQGHSSVRSSWAPSWCHFLRY